MTPFEAYTKYLALKSHFTSDYDYIKYAGKVKATVESFEGRRDIFQFKKLAKKNKDVDKYLIANFFRDPNFWVGDVGSEEADKAFADMDRRWGSLSYLFSEEIKKIDNLKEWLAVGTQFPKLFMAYKRKKISPETINIMDDCINMYSYWEKRIDDDVIFQPEINKLRKYKTFITYDIHRFKNTLREAFR